MVKRPRSTGITSRFLFFYTRHCRTNQQNLFMFRILIRFRSLKSVFCLSRFCKNIFTIKMIDPNNSDVANLLMLLLLVRRFWGVFPTSVIFVLRGHTWGNRGGGGRGWGRKLLLMFSMYSSLETIATQQSFHLLRSILLVFDNSFCLYHTKN